MKLVTILIIVVLGVIAFYFLNKNSMENNTVNTPTVQSYDDLIAQKMSWENEFTKKHGFSITIDFNPLHFKNDINADFTSDELNNLNVWINAITRSIDEIATDPKDAETLKGKIQTITFLADKRKEDESSDPRTYMEIMSTFDEEKTYNSLYIVRKLNDYKAGPKPNLTKEIKETLGM